MSQNNKIPFLDLVASQLEVEQELISVFREALHTAGFIGGRPVEDFEKDFAQFSECSHCVGLSSGTDAVRFALMAAGVQAGDAVVTVAHTFIATAEGISQSGAHPEFIDVDERTYNMDPVKLQEFFETQCEVDKATGKPRSRRTGRLVTAIVPVHLYGQMVDMDAILQLAETYKLIVVEDACQAHGAEYFSRKDRRWKKAGSIGKAAAFSFYPGKNLGACGEAGAVTTNDPAIAQKIRMLRDHGQSKKYYHDIEGYNGRLDAIQAGILQVKLARLTKWNSDRRELATRYNSLFLEAKALVTVPYEPSWSRAVHHLYVVRAKNREGLMDYLKEVGIGTGIHYPIPLHLQKAYASLNYRAGDLPVSEKASVEIVSLPMYPQLTTEQQSRVVEEVLRFVGHNTVEQTASENERRLAIPLENTI